MKPARSLLYISLANSYLENNNHEFLPYWMIDPIIWFKFNLKFNILLF